MLNVPDNNKILWNDSLIIIKGMHSSDKCYMYQFDVLCFRIIDILLPTWLLWSGNNIATWKTAFNPICVWQWTVRVLWLMP